jgi:hypothetical protein
MRVLRTMDLTTSKDYGERERVRRAGQQERLMCPASAAESK